MIHLAGFQTFAAYTGESLHGQFAFMIRTPAIGFRPDTLSSIAIIATSQAYDRPATLRYSLQSQNDVRVMHHRGDNLPAVVDLAERVGLAQPL
jgi:hypothetical protein